MYYKQVIFLNTWGFVPLLAQSFSDDVNVYDNRIDSACSACYLECIPSSRILLALSWLKPTSSLFTMDYVHVDVR